MGDGDDVAGGCCLLIIALFLISTFGPGVWEWLNNIGFWNIGYWLLALVLGILIINEARKPETP